MYIFKDEFRTNIDQIDQEHKKLFEIANQAYEILMDEFIVDKYDYIVDVLNELKEYAATHFRNEEEYMLSIRYKKFFAHKEEHDAFIEKISDYDMGTVDEYQREVILELLEYLNNWLIHHIMELDKHIA